MFAAYQAVIVREVACAGHRGCQPRCNSNKPTYGPSWVVANTNRTRAGPAGLGLICQNSMGVMQADWSKIGARNKAAADVAGRLQANAHNRP